MTEGLARVIAEMREYAKKACVKFEQTGARSSPDEAASDCWTCGWSEPRHLARKWADQLERLSE